MADEAFPDHKKLHVVMFPWLAFGHIIPFLELSKFLVQKGHKISFISTPRNIDRLPKIPSNLASSLTFVKIPLSKIEGLPENAEATVDVRTEDIQYLKKAYDDMEPKLTLFLENSGADAIIYDFVGHWLPPIAAKLGISRYFFCIFNSQLLVFLGKTETIINNLEGRTKPEDLMIPPEWIKFDTKIAYRLYEAKPTYFGIVEKNASGFTDMYRVGMVISGSDAIIIRDCNEFEPEWLKLLQELHKPDLIPLGLMPPQVQETKDGDDDNESWICIGAWLNSQSKSSVLYVAFGSEVTLSKDQVHELALGLELSQLPFFWAARKLVGPKEMDVIKLPDGFEERVKGRGVVWKNWAPQLKILGHDSIGAFLTHCGWSSLIEGLTFGKPLVLLPFWGDQGLNSRILAAKQVGIEIQRNEEDGSFTRNSVAQCVRSVMVDDGAENYRNKAKEASLMCGNRELHDGYLDKFEKYMAHKYWQEKKTVPTML